MHLQSASMHRTRRRCFLALLVVLLLVVFWLLYLRAAAGGSSSPTNPHTSPGGPTSAIRCSAIYQLEPTEIGKALVARRQAAAAGDGDDASVVAMTADCGAFVRARGYDAVPVTEEERGFPLAFSLVVHKNARMVERILRAAYAPHNLYCLHADSKAPPAFRRAVRGLASCLPNVFLASRPEAVEYAHVSRLNADLRCLADLLASPRRWEYVINLCGQDFPLRSNGELAAELRQLNGSNMLESRRPSEQKKQRFLFRHELRSVPYEYRRLPVRTVEPKAPPPHGVQVFTGSAYFVLSREFVRFVSSSPVAADFLAWSADAYSPDEHFWASLVRAPGAPGRLLPDAPDVTDLESRTRLVKWRYLEGWLYPACTGTHQRSVCIYGAAELRWLLHNGHWFANKVDPGVDEVLIGCLEEMLQERQQRLVLRGGGAQR